ncbi:hypothetical protein VTI74DRAFT_5515 [Chaetomium olivicolor]
MSHPFPSLFSGKKKRSGPMPGAKDSASDSSDDYGTAPSSSAKGMMAPSSHGHRNGSSVGSRDFVTGRCMTCGSLVRWPRELQVFKCTICLTINHLQPVDWAPRREDGREAPTPPEEKPAQNDKPISVRYTKALVERCLRSFLLGALKGRSTGGSMLGPEPPVTPIRVSSDQTRHLAAPAAVHPSLRPKGSLTFESRLSPGGPSRGPGVHRRAPSWAGTPSSPCSPSISEHQPPLPRGHENRPVQPPPNSGSEAKRIFKPLEDYIVTCFTSFQCLNYSFLTPRSQPQPRPAVENKPARPFEPPNPRKEQPGPSHLVPDLDPKLLLLGDFAENGTWWTGQEQLVPGRTPSGRSQNGLSTVSSRSPHIDWAALDNWYVSATEPARLWSDIYASLVADEPALAVPPAVLQEIEAQILAGQEHTQRALLKACETILRRPGRRISEPQELRFLLVIAANPLLHASYKPYAGEFPQPAGAVPTPSSPHPRGSGPASGRHSVIIKRIVGLMSNTPLECHNHLVAWFVRYPESRFVQTKDLIAGFLAFRLLRQNEKKHEAQIDLTAGLIPSMAAGQSPASLHAALGQTQRQKKKEQEKKKVIYQEDWQIKAAAQVLGFLFAANNMGHAHRNLANRPESPGNRSRELVQAPGQILATSDFYMTLLDDSDLITDFDTWERKQGRFSFCQHPFLLSIGAKIQILEHDARRQMENKARDAFFDSIMTNRIVQQFLMLNIRRECLVEDSLKAVSEVIGAGGGDIKKGLKINFKGEEGVDAGGLRKEWFLLLVREVFNPDHGMFLYDEDSQYCYFNPNSLEPSEQFFLVGVVMGLAIYNSTILDVALPPFAFRKLLLAAPPPSIPISQPRQPMTYTLEDLAEYRPRLAHGLRQLLDFEGDVESTFCLEFAIDTDRYGTLEKVPLCPNGARRPVTNANRREYVDAYVRYLLDTAVTRQFEPFKRGFFTVADGAALSLFRPEEIELLIRGSGSDQPLDVAALKTAAHYDNWPSPNPAEEEDTVVWFWETFEEAEPSRQRKLLAFVTGSDRVPATGAASLGIRVSCLGEDEGRFPTARTCFNSLGLWRVGTKERLEELLWRAVGESEGFGLK